MTTASVKRDALLERAIAHLAAHGLRDTSLRSIAGALGTSHRMLSYYFGSRRGLLLAVVREVEARQRAALATLLDDRTASPLDVVRRMHARLADPELWPSERLFFELYARALQGDPDVAPLLDGDAESWVAPTAALFGRLGFGEREARAESRLALAVARGLLLDLLANRDRAAVDAAMEQYVAGLEARAPTPPRRSRPRAR